jgi:hypothetical protein
VNEYWQAEAWTQPGTRSQWSAWRAQLIGCPEQRLVLQAPGTIAQAQAVPQTIIIRVRLLNIGGCFEV